MNVRGLLFDFDGLLVDTETPGRRSWEEIYREHGHELPLDQWATKIGTIGTPFDPATQDLAARLVLPVVAHGRHLVREVVGIVEAGLRERRHRSVLHPRVVGF